MPLTFVDPAADSVPLHCVASDAVADWLKSQDAFTNALASASGFSGKLGQVLPIPSKDGAVVRVAVGVGSNARRARGRFALAAAASKVPALDYHIASGLENLDADEQALGCLLSGYVFNRYNNAKPKPLRIKAPDNIDAAKIEAIANGEALTRDLINTPACDMGPDALEAATRDLAAQFGADLSVKIGEALQQEFPMIHTVGRAAAIAPRLLDLRWGAAGPTLTLVGKGVCFDTGGLNIKPGASMGLMKKDMGGGATVLGLAQMIMALNLPLKLRVLIPAVENNIDGNAFRPGDILTSRKGLTVEINNTDAEGRLVLADALALADEEAPDLMISMATLTGAARVAVGPDLAPFYATDPVVADALRIAAKQAADPVWELPFHDPYESMIEPGIADLDNAPRGGFAGSITAALFLRRFVEETPRYAHFDIYGWQPTDAPGRPKGGVGMGARAILAALPNLMPL